MGALLNRDAAAAGILKGVTYVPFDAEVTLTTLVTGRAKKIGITTKNAPALTRPQGVAP
jgi:hypothetical protein